MGGAGDKTHRSSSPLKRPASELEEDSTIVANGDVDMKDRPEASVNGANNSSKRSNNTPPPASIANMGMKNEPNPTDDMDTDGEDEELYATAAPAAALPAENESKSDAQNIDSKRVDATIAVPVDAPDIDALPAPPSIDEQIRMVTALVGDFGMPEAAGTRAYIISNKWLDRVKAHGTGAKVSAEVAESDVGPVDNSDIIWEVLTDQNNQPFARLNPDVADGVNISYFPQKAWDLVVSWYGLKEGQPPIVRTAVDTSTDSSQPNIQFETHPVVYRVHRLWAAESPIPIAQLVKAQKPPPRTWIVGRNEKMQGFLQLIKKSTGVESTRKVNLWTVPESLDKLKTSPSSATPSRSNTPVPDAIDWSQMLVEAHAFNALQLGAQREKVDYKDQCANANFNGSRTIDMTGLGKDERLVIDELVEGDHLHLSAFVNKLKKGGKSAALSTTVRGASSALTTTDSGRSSPAPAPVIRMSTRGRGQGKTVGCVGLSNLGNTCYMNSALQCIRSVEELTKYFLSGEASEELNTENPLGKGGNIAMVYHGLLKDMYKIPVPPSVTPRQFKNTIGRYFPNFSGYGQQDSQEFLGLLLDALQEDLNRIKKKPYIEKPDSTDEMVNDPVALKKMADEVWSITKRRDDSVISDLFTGMYKSTVVCPECDKVSITFDPFNTVTVQIPIESTWSHRITFMPLNGKPFFIDVDMDKNGTVKGMKQFISTRTGVPINRLFILEDWKSKIFKFPEDVLHVAEDISANDSLMVFELDMVPTNLSSFKKPKQKIRSMLYVDREDTPEEESRDNPQADRMVVPVLFRRKPTPKKGYLHNSSKSWEFTMQPQVICVTRDEARSEKAIRRKILQRVQNLTTYKFGSSSDDSESETGEESVDPDLVVTTASDASSGDGKVAARSVDGEDELVDVTMREAAASSPRSATHSKKKFPGQTTPPKWVNPAVDLPGPFDRMFDICYFEGAEIVPSGWNGVNEDKHYPSISGRILQRQEVAEEPLADQETTPVSSEDDDDVAQLGESVTRMNEESSDEDDDLAAKKILPLRSISQRKSFNVGSRHRPRKGLITYSKKKSTNKSPLISPHFGGDGSGESLPAEELEQEPLVRLYEGLLVDWDEKYVKALMDGEEESGSNTYTDCPTLEDRELEKKRNHRKRRRDQGVSLSECLDEFGKEEVLSEMDTWYCPRCKEHRRASKKLELWKTPDILILHFKRFSSTSHRRDKLDVQVDFPLEGLDMTKRIVESDGKEEVYDLFAVDNHYGSLGGGHYTACAKSFVDGEWYDYNDSSVSKIKNPAHDIVSSAAYLLFYRRRSSGTALGGPKFQSIVQSFKETEEEEGDDDGEGNGPGLGGDSPSRNGSSSAFGGVGGTAPIQGLGREAGMGMGMTGAAQRGGMLSPLASPVMDSYSLGGQRAGGRRLGTGTGVGLGAGMGVMGRSNVPAGLNLSSPSTSHSKFGAQHIENLPDYREAVDEGMESAQPILGDVVLNQGIQLRDEGYEDIDEGVDMNGPDLFDTNRYSPNGSLRQLYKPSWNFDHVRDSNSNIGTPNSAAGEDGDIDSVAGMGSGLLASDVVDNGSEASASSLRGRLDDFENADVDEEYYEAPMEVPDLDESGAAGAVDLFDLSDDIVQQKMARMGGRAGGIGAYDEELELEMDVQVPMVGEGIGREGEGVEDEAMEIHVEEGEGLGKL